MDIWVFIHKAGILGFIDRYFASIVRILYIKTAYTTRFGRSWVRVWRV
jgi:hypothetical protein